MLADGPVIPERLIWVVEAFGDLSTCRTSGMGGPGPIPWTALDAWACRLGLDEDGYEVLRFLVAAMDAAWLDHMETQAKAKAKAPGKGR